MVCLTLSQHPRANVHDALKMTEEWDCQNSIGFMYVLRLWISSRENCSCDFSIVQGNEPQDMFQNNLSRHWCAWKCVSVVYCMYIEDCLCVAYTSFLQAMSESFITHYLDLVFSYPHCFSSILSILSICCSSITQNTLILIFITHVLIHINSTFSHSFSSMGFSSCLFWVQFTPFNIVYLQKKYKLRHIYCYGARKGPVQRWYFCFHLVHSRFGSRFSLYSHASPLATKNNISANQVLFSPGNDVQRHPYCSCWQTQDCHQQE